MSSAPKGYKLMQGLLLVWLQRSVTQQKHLPANFHEKAQSVKADVAARLVVECNGSSSFALCFHPHFQ